jgi:alpha,alpha-trehalose-phosphate synthase [UDP-forming]
VRRLAALGITLALGWFVVLEWGGGASGSTALALGMALLAASIAGWLVSFVHLPRVTGYLVFGLICGPVVANILTIDMARDLRAASGFAIALIAFIAGLQLKLVNLADVRRLLSFSFATTVLAWAGLALALTVAWPLLPIDPDLSGIQRFMVIALAATLLVGVSTTVSVAIIAEARASGPLASFATNAVVVIELIVVALFGLLLHTAHVIFATTTGGFGEAIAEVAWTMVGSAAFGAVFGALFALYVRLIGREITLAFLALCAIIAGLGVRLDLAPLVAGVTAGLVSQRALRDESATLLEGIREGATPVFVLFFTAIGANMNVEAIATVGYTALALAAVRFGVFRIATRLAVGISGIDAPHAKRAWRALLPTSGLTLGFALTVATDFPGWGTALQTIVVASVAYFDLIAPIIFRASLVETGEAGASTGGLVVVSNREPWMHVFEPDGTIAVKHTPGGVSVALDALMRERGGVWVAHGAGSADRVVVDENSTVDVPPEAPAYRLRRVWLTEAEVEGYYAGFSNNALWPLCHQAHVRPQFRAEEWETYQSVNRKFAEIVATDAPMDSSVFLNDYHLTLVAQYLRERRPRLRTAIFWHIPWPDVDRLRICPWRRELLEGLLSNDLVAFQLPRDQRNFLNGVQEELGVSVSGETAFFGDRQVRVVNVPIGADFDRIEEILADAELTGRIERLDTELKLEGKAVGVGVDRLDYTKGIPERMRAIELVLERRPDIAQSFAFVQIGVPSREEVAAYAEISAEIEADVARINQKFALPGEDGPIRYIKQSLPLPELVALYRRARFCIVSSLHDGMNLVAKEFVAAREDHDGVLILSELAGAAQELHEALIINPYDERGFADAVERAVVMPPWERRQRMQALRRRVAGRDVLAWASDILDRLERRKGHSFLAG